MHVRHDIQPFSQANGSWLHWESLKAPKPSFEEPSSTLDTHLSHESNWTDEDWTRVENLFRVRHDYEKVSGRNDYERTLRLKDSKQVLRATGSLHSSISKVLRSESSYSVTKRQRLYRMLCLSQESKKLAACYEYWKWKGSNWSSLASLVSSRDFSRCS